jgi:hypothetical protein
VSTLPGAVSVVADLDGMSGPTEPDADVVLVAWRRGIAWVDAQGQHTLDVASRSGAFWATPGDRGPITVDRDRVLGWWGPPRFGRASVLAEGELRERSDLVGLRTELAVVDQTAPGRVLWIDGSGEVVDVAPLPEGAVVAAPIATGLLLSGNGVLRHLRAETSEPVIVGEADVANLGAGRDADADGSVIMIENDGRIAALTASASGDFRWMRLGERNDEAYRSVDALPGMRGFLARTTTTLQRFGSEGGYRWSVTFDDDFPADVTAASPGAGSILLIANRNGARIVLLDDRDGAENFDVAATLQGRPERARTDPLSHDALIATTSGVIHRVPALADPDARGRQADR